MLTGNMSGAYLTVSRRNSRYTLNTSNFNANNAVGNNGQWVFVRQQDGTYIIHNKNYESYGAYIYYTGNNSYGVTDNSNNATKLYAELSEDGNRVGFYCIYNNTKRYFRLDNYGNYSANPVYFYLVKRVSVATLIRAPTQEENVAQVDIVDGHIKGNVYGGSNQNNINGCSITTMKSGIVDGSIYGGSNSSGTIAQNVTVEITGGTIGDGTHDDAVFAGGLGETTVVARNATLTIRDDDETINITGNIYGGSSQGSINGTSTTTIYNDTSDDTGEGSKKIILHSEVYGGGRGKKDDGIVAYNKNSTTVNVDGLDNSSSVTVFGGANENGSTTGSMLVYIGSNQTTYVNAVYGGGNLADVASPTTECKVYINSHGTVNKAFGGGNRASINGAKNALQRSITVDGGTVLDSLYGGSNEEGELQYSHVILQNSATAKTVYGAGCGKDTNVGETDVSITGSTVNMVYGGGDAGSFTGNTSVTINSSSVPITTTIVDGQSVPYGGNVYGGGRGTDAIVGGNTSVTITSSTTTSTIEDSVYGGGDSGAVSGNTNISTTGTIVTSDRNSTRLNSSHSV